MTEIARKTREIHNCQPNAIPDEVFSSPVPILLKGLMREWPLVQKGLSSDEQAIDYLKSFYSGRPAGVYFGEPEIEGRFFYNEDATKLNFSVRRTPLDQALDEIQLHLKTPKPPSFYITSNVIDTYFPGLRDENDLCFDGDYFKQNPFYTGDPLVSIWIGNASLVSCHFDAPKNLACCAAGNRRFTLFPPDQIDNLYPGPLEPTPGGQVISMVNFKNPDFDKHPRFRDAMAAGEVAEMEAGDAVYIPSMWWHQVEALSAFNVLVNYWWNTVPKFFSPAKNVLEHAMLGLRDRPLEEKRAWKALFDYYIFSEVEHASGHIPAPARGDLNPIDERSARQLRARLINQLNR